VHIFVAVLDRYKYRIYSETAATSSSPLEFEIAIAVSRKYKWSVSDEMQVEIIEGGEEISDISKPLNSIRNKK
jgi:hypothetical protein